jgi:hypothetical protein
MLLEGSKMGGAWAVFHGSVRTGKKKAPSREAKCLIFMVGGASFELATPAV